MTKPKLIRCSEVAAHICDHLDADIRTKRCREIQRHIRTCPNCYAYLDSMKKTVRLYKIQRSPTLPRAARSRLLAILPLKRQKTSVKRRMYER